MLIIVIHLEMYILYIYNISLVTELVDRTMDVTMGVPIVLNSNYSILSELFCVP